MGLVIVVLIVVAWVLGLVYLVAHGRGYQAGYMHGRYGPRR
jgi:hypothetical protein